MLHLLPISSHTNLYIFIIIVNKSMQGVNIVVVTGNLSGIGFGATLLLSKNRLDASPEFPIFFEAVHPLINNRERRNVQLEVRES